MVKPLALPTSRRRNLCGRLVAPPCLWRGSSRRPGSVAFSLTTFPPTPPQPLQAASPALSPGPCPRCPRPSTLGSCHSTKWGHPWRESGGGVGPGLGWTPVGPGAWGWGEGVVPTKETEKQAGAGGGQGAPRSPFGLPSSIALTLPLPLLRPGKSDSPGSRRRSRKQGIYSGLNGKASRAEQELAGAGRVCKQPRSAGKRLEGRVLPKIIQGAAVSDSETGSGCLSCGEPQAPHRPSSGNRWH